MVGQQIGRYRIDREIGRGGMGVVYKGTQVSLDRTVAIKMLASHLADADASARFQREALTLAKLAHPNIILIYDVEEYQGSQFIIMEYVDGGSLADTLETTPVLSPGRVVEVMAPVLAGLAAAHKQGIIHRDIKPDNILFTDTGRPKVTDFGIAHMRGANSKTRTGVMLGTPYYMSPEQARGRKVTPAADIYASGILMYEALTGRVPFTAEDAVSVALMHVQAEAEPIESIRPDVPTALCDVVRIAMAKDPAHRFESAAAMEDALVAGGWAPRTSGSGSAVVVPMTASAGATSVAAGVSGIKASLGGLGDGVARLGQGTGSLLAATGTLLRRPGWKGMPMAFWLGAMALGGVALVGGVQAMSGQDEAPPEVQPEIQTSDGPTRPAAGGPSRRRRPTSGRVPAIVEPRQITPEQTAAISGVRNPDAAASSTGSAPPASPEASRADPDPPPQGRRPTITEPRANTTPARATPAPVTPARTTTAEESARESAADDRAWQTTASQAIRAAVARQGTAFETEDRSLFLRDVHPNVKADAARLFDAAMAAESDWSVQVTNLQVSFAGRTQASVTYDLEMSRVNRRVADRSTLPNLRNSGL